MWLFLVHFIPVVVFSCFQAHKYDVFEFNIDICREFVEKMLLVFIIYTFQGGPISLAFSCLFWDDAA